MNYTVSLITKKPDCEALISIATEDRDSFIYRKTGLERQRTSTTDTSQDIETELASVNIELAALQSIIDNLPEGKTKQDTLDKFKRSEFRKYFLERRRGNYGILAVLAKEFDIACVEKDIVESEAFLEALNARMAEL